MTVRGPYKRDLPTNKQAHYKIVTISLYNEDLQELDRLVAVLRERGFHKANRSALLRYAIGVVDIDKIEQGVMR